LTSTQRCIVPPVEFYISNSALGELFEDGKHLNYTVETELHVRSLKFGSPQNEKLDYGNEVKLTSQVVDKITKKAAVFAGAGKSTIYLALRHQGGKSTPIH